MSLCHITRSRNDLKLLYPYYHNIYRHKTWQAGDLSSGASTHNVTPPFGHVALRDHVPNSKQHAFTTRMPMATKRGRMMIYLE